MKDEPIAQTKGSEGRKLTLQAKPMMVNESFGKGVIAGEDLP